MRTSQPKSFLRRENPLDKFAINANPERRVEAQTAISIEKRESELKTIVEIIKEKYPSLRNLKLEDMIDIGYIAEGTQEACDIRLVHYKDRFANEIPRIRGIIVDINEKVKKVIIESEGIDKKIDVWTPILYKFDLMSIISEIYVSYISTNGVVINIVPGKVHNNDTNTWIIKNVMSVSGDYAYSGKVPLVFGQLPKTLHLFRDNDFDECKDNMLKFSAEEEDVYNYFPENVESVTFKDKDNKVITLSNEEEGGKTFDISPSLEGIIIRIFRYKGVTYHATYKNMFTFGGEGRDPKRASHYETATTNFSQDSSQGKYGTIQNTFRQAYEKAKGPKEDDFFFLNLTMDRDEMKPAYNNEKEFSKYCYVVMLICPDYTRSSRRIIGDNGKVALIDIKELVNFDSETINKKYDLPRMFLTNYYQGDLIPQEDQQKNAFVYGCVAILRNMTNPHKETISFPNEVNENFPRSFDNGKIYMLNLHDAVFNHLTPGNMNQIFVIENYFEKVFLHIMEVLSFHLNSGNIPLGGYLKLSQLAFSTLAYVITIDHKDFVAEYAKRINYMINMSDFNLNILRETIPSLQIIPKKVSVTPIDYNTTDSKEIEDMFYQKNVYKKQNDEIFRGTLNFNNGKTTIVILPGIEHKMNVLFGNDPKRFPWAMSNEEDLTILENKYHNDVLMGLIDCIPGKRRNDDRYKDRRLAENDALVIRSFDKDKNIIAVYTVRSESYAWREDNKVVNEVPNPNIAHTVFGVYERCMVGKSDKNQPDISLKNVFAEDLLQIIVMSPDLSYTDENTQITSVYKTGSSSGGNKIYNSIRASDFVSYKNVTKIGLIGELPENQSIENLEEVWENEFRCLLLSYSPYHQESILRNQYRTFVENSLVLVYEFGRKLSMSKDKSLGSYLEPFKNKADAYKTYKGEHSTISSSGIIKKDKKLVALVERIYGLKGREPEDSNEIKMFMVEFLKGFLKKDTSEYVTLFSLWVKAIKHIDDSNRFFFYVDGPPTGGASRVMQQKGSRGGSRGGFKTSSSRGKTQQSTKPNYNTTTSTREQPTSRGKPQVRGKTQPRGSSSYRGKTPK